MDSFDRWVPKMQLSGWFYEELSKVSISKELVSNLSDAVSSQIADLTKDFEGKGIEELPDNRDLTSYADAYKSAVKNCQHNRKQKIINFFTGEYYCEDCNKQFNIND